MSDARTPVAQGEAERFVPDGHGPLIRYEHLHRYVLACRVVAGRRVLDLGCGSGYGSRLLRAAGADVISVDFDRAAARCLPGARARGEQLPFRDASFDAVVCFETLEHLPEPGALVREVARVVARDGFALLSTPDREIYSGRAGNRNPYHLAELTQEELRALLAHSFRAVTLYGQSVWAGSWIARLDAEGAPARAEERAFRVLEAPPLDARATAGAPWTRTGDARAPIPMYLVAVCARSQKTLERVEAALGAESLLHDSGQGLIGDYLGALLDVASRDQQLLSFEKHGANLEKLLADQEAVAAGHHANAENLARRLEEETRAGAGHRAHADNQTRLLAEREAELAGLRVHAATLEELRAGLDAHLDNLKRGLAEREANAAGHRAHAENLAAAVAERDAQIAGLEEHGANLAQLLAARDAQISGLQEHGENLARHVAGLQQHGENLARLVAEREAHVAGLQQHGENLARLIAERDARIASLQEHGETIAAALADRDAQIARVRAECAELARQLGEQTEILARIRASRWFRVLERAGVFEP